jgi:hypothetical protein
MSDERYFHGGAPGLKPGDLIEPQPYDVGRHLIAGCPTCEARKAGDPLAADNNDPTKVYVTTDREYARVYAIGYPLGALYVVTPLGELTESPDPVPSWGCSAATVRGVYDACVRMSPAEVRRAVRRYLA